MKVTATIVASSAALVSLTQGACPDGYGIQDGGGIIPMNVCLASPAPGAANDDGGVRATKYTCDANGVYAETYDDYQCTNTVDAAAATNVFNDANGDAQVTCESVENCDYYHIHEFAGTDGQACGSITDAVTADDTAVESYIWTSGVINAADSEYNVNSCESDGGSGFTRTSIADGYCTSPTTGTFITYQPYDDDQCITETAGSTPDTYELTSATDNAVNEEGDFVCNVWVECSSAAIITSAPTTAPTEAPSAEPTEAPSAEPTAAPVPTEAPSDAPSASPTAAPVSTETDAPTASPVATDAPSAAPTSATTTAAPTTASSASQLSSIVALLMASYYAIIA